MVSDCYFNGAQNFLAHFADRRSQNGHSFRGIPVENGQKILMDKAFVGIAPAAGQQGVFGADGGGLPEGSPDVKFIVALQIFGQKAPSRHKLTGENLPSVLQKLLAHGIADAAIGACNKDRFHRIPPHHSIAFFNSF